MELRVAIERASESIRSGVLKNEADVKHAIIVPILRELGWDDTNPREFLPEYQVESGLVDFALFVHKKPQVFVEAKRLGNLSAKAEEQLFNYAAHKGIPLLVLTDGNTWDFYLSMAAGDPSNRRYCRIELDTQDGSLLSQHEESFQRFLGKEQVASERAKRDAEKLHEDTKRRAQAKAAIPDAWESLLNPPNELLIELLAEEVEGACGIRPRDEDLESFFSHLHGAPVGQVSPGKEGSKATKVPSSEPAKSTPSRRSVVPSGNIAGYRYRSREVPCPSGRATLVAVLQEFQANDASFLGRLHADPRNRGKSNAFVSKERGELYRTPLPEGAYRELGGGWWVGTNLSNESIIRKINIACDVAGVEFGTELTLLGE